MVYLQYRSSGRNSKIRPFIKKSWPVFWRLEQVGGIYRDGSKQFRAIDGGGICLGIFQTERAARKVIIDRAKLPIPHDGGAWRKIPQHPEYAINECGDLRRVVAVRSRSVGSIVGGTLRNGYRRYRLNGPNGPVWRSAHRLVLTVFVGPSPRGKRLALHNNGHRGDSHVINLRWGSAKDNAADAARHHQRPRTTKRKLTRAVAQQMRREYGEVGSLRLLANRYGLSIPHVSRVVAGRRWRNVEARP